MHLKYCLMVAMIGRRITKHPQQIMKELGIKYQFTTPQSISDQWWFWNFENIPKKLPEYLSELKIKNPKEFVGYGISEEMANEIINYKNI